MSKNTPSKNYLPCISLFSSYSKRIIRGCESSIEPLYSLPGNPYHVSSSYLDNPVRCIGGILCYIFMCLKYDIIFINIIKKIHDMFCASIVAVPGLFLAHSKYIYKPYICLLRRLWFALEYYAMPIVFLDP